MSWGPPTASVSAAFWQVGWPTHLPELPGRREGRSRARGCWFAAPGRSLRSPSPLLPRNVSWRWLALAGPALAVIWRRLGARFSCRRGQPAAGAGEFDWRGEDRVHAPRVGASSCLCTEPSSSLAAPVPKQRFNFWPFNFAAFAVSIDRGASRPRSRHPCRRDARVGHPRPRVGI